MEIYAPNDVRKIKIILVITLNAAVNYGSYLKTCDDFVFSTCYSWCVLKLIQQHFLKKAMHVFFTDHLFVLSLLQPTDYITAVTYTMLS